MCSARSPGCDRRTCSHISDVQREYSDVAAEYARIQQAAESLNRQPRVPHRDYSSVSRYTVELPLQKDLRKLLSSGCDSVSEFPSALKPALPLDEKGNPVPCEHGFTYGDTYLQNGSLRCHLSHGSVTRPVFTLKSTCGHAKCDIAYDGRPHALWIASPSTAYSLEVLLKVIDQVIPLLQQLLTLLQMKYNHGSILGSYNCTTDSHRRHCDLACELPHYSRFRKHFHAFLPFVKPDGHVKLCPHCCNSPRILICDGTIDNLILKLMASCVLRLFCLCRNVLPNAPRLFHRAQHHGVLRRET